MRQSKREAAGHLLAPEHRKVVERAQDAANARTVDAPLLHELRAIDASMPAGDPDAGALRMVFAQAATAHFETTLDPGDADTALDIARTVPDHADTLPAWLATYERGRTAYQVGKRLRDVPLLEEAVHFYRLATTHLSLLDRRRYTLWRYRREAEAVRRDATTEARAQVFNQGLIAAILTIALDAFPAAADTRHERGLRGQLSRSPERIYCQPLDLAAEATFRWSGDLTPMLKRQGQINERGRVSSGLMHILAPDTSTLVNQMTLTVWTGTNDPDEARQIMREKAPELYEWAERVSQWADIITGRLPTFGHRSVTRYLYGDLAIPNGGTETLTLNADEPGIMWHLVLEHGKDVSRYELSYILNRLTHHEVPIAVEMLQKAQHSRLADQARQAVIEAGTAAEAALSVLYDADPTTPPRDRKERSWTLGTLVAKAHKAGILPVGDTEEVLKRELVQPRNDAVHRGHATRAQAVDAIEAARRIVNQTFNTGTRDVVAIDCRMRQLAPVLPPRPTVRAGFPLPSDGSSEPQDT